MALKIYNRLKDAWSKRKHALETRKEEKTQERQKKRESTRKRRFQGWQRAKGTIGQAFKGYGSFLGSAFDKVTSFPKKMIEMSPIGQFGKMGDKAKTIVFVVGGIALVLVLMTVLKGGIKTQTAGVLG